LLSLNYWVRSLAKVQANDIELEYEDFGPKDGPVVIHIMGFASQLIRWPVSFAEGMASRGYRFIRFDNRDIGLSQKLPELGIPNISALTQQAIAGEKIEAPYTLYDMADDVVGLMDSLAIEKTHIMGESMGGMIAQIFAHRHAARCRSLISVMSTSSRPHLPLATPEAMAVLMNRPQNPHDREEAVHVGTHARMILAGPAYNPGEDYQRMEAEKSFDRSIYPEGPARQMAASMASRDREDLLKEINKPTLVIHGADDPLVLLAGGEDTAALIPGADLCVVPGMGHAVEPDLVPEILGIIEDFISRHD
jgi:pimeloyl-ACP methyl ester carboxylesterase